MSSNVSGSGAFPSISQVGVGSGGGDLQSFMNNTGSLGGMFAMIGGAPKPKPKPQGGGVSLPDAPAPPPEPPGAVGGLSASYQVLGYGYEPAEVAQIGENIFAAQLPWSQGQAVGKYFEYDFTSKIIKNNGLEFPSGHIWGHELEYDERRRLTSPFALDNHGDDAGTEIYCIFKVVNTYFAIVKNGTVIKVLKGSSTGTSWSTVTFTNTWGAAAPSVPSDGQRITFANFSDNLVVFMIDDGTSHLCFINISQNKWYHTSSWTETEGNCCCVYDNRVLVGGKNRHTIYYTKRDWDFTSNGFTGEGSGNVNIGSKDDEIIKMSIFNNGLYVIKDNAIWVRNSRHTEIGSEDFACQRSIIPKIKCAEFFNGELYLITQQGLWKYNQGDVENLSFRILPEINLSGTWYLGYDDDRERILISDTSNSYIYKFNTISKTWEPRESLYCKAFFNDYKFMGVTIIPT